MNIVILADSFLPYICGVTTHTVELARGLIRNGHSVLILAPKYKETPVLPKELARARVVYLTSVPTAYQNLRICTPSFYRLARELSSFHPTLFYAQNPSILSIEAQQFAKLFSVPYVGSFHTLYATDAYLEMAFRTKYAKSLKPGIWTLLRWFYNGSDHVIVPTASIADHVAKNGINKKNMSVLPSLLDIEKPILLTPSQKTALKKHYKLNTSVVGFLGRLSIDKRIDRLLSIWSKVVTKVPDSTLVLIGRAGSYQKEIDALIAKYQLSGHVVCTGPIDHGKLLSTGILSILDLFVSTSDTDTFGLSMLECMAHGVPVVVPPASGMSDIVGNAGIVCTHNTNQDIARTMVKVLSDEKLRKTLSSNAKKLSEKYSGKTGISGYIEEFERVIKKYHKKH